MGRPEKPEKIIAICDSDLSYAGRLVEYLRQEAAFPCEIRQYTGADKLLQDPESRSASLIVIAQSQYTLESTRKMRPRERLARMSGKSRREIVRYVVTTAVAALAAYFAAYFVTCALL